MSFHSIFLLAGGTQETFSQRKQIRQKLKKEKEEDEETVQSIRKATKRVIVSDDEIDLEDIIEDSSPMKSKVDEEPELGFNIEDEEDFFQDDLYDNYNEEEKKEPGLGKIQEPQDCRETPTPTPTDAVADATQVKTQSQDFFQTLYGKVSRPSRLHPCTPRKPGTEPFLQGKVAPLYMWLSLVLQTQAEYVDYGPLSPPPSTFNTQAQGDTFISSPKDAERTKPHCSKPQPPKQASVRHVAPTATRPPLSRTHKSLTSLPSASKKEQDPFSVPHTGQVSSSSRTAPGLAPASQGRPNKVQPFAAPHTKQRPSGDCAPLQDRDHMPETSTANIQSCGSSIGVMMFSKKVQEGDDAGNKLSVVNNGATLQYYHLRVEACGGIHGAHYEGSVASA
ncbi:hypothetical protein GWK47_003869 [Chionoecetes opilio]|uniref:Uncharacterized protein n=1 Tax=Chionoecetes opilio TaxID=41210 RepID=A0A8J5D3F1_CHIOP|nr:hypothetical protein GWK47_003869 [Chionoecetes opilio]